MKYIASIVLLSSLVSAVGHTQTAMRCTLAGDNDDPVVTISIPTPHPGEMTVQTPDGRRIWLQASHIPVLFPDTDDFEHLAEVVLTRDARGSWFNDWGEAEIVPVLGMSGTYIVRVADDLESGPDGDLLLACEFKLP